MRGGPGLGIHDVVEHLLAIKIHLIIAGGGNGPVTQVNDVRVCHPFFRILNGDSPGFTIRPGTPGPDVSPGIDEKVGAAGPGKYSGRELPVSMIFTLEPGY